MEKHKRKDSAAQILAKHKAKKEAKQEAKKEPKKESKTSKLVELLKSGGGTIPQLLDKTGFTILALRSMLYWHLPKRGLKINRSKEGVYSIT